MPSKRLEDVLVAVFIGISIGMFITALYYKFIN